MKQKEPNPILEEIEHLPDDYGFGATIPSAFKLDEEKKKANPLLEYKTELDIQEAPSTAGGTKEDKQLEADFDLARANIKTALENTSSVITDAVALAQSSDSPRAFEVVATLLKSISDANRDLLNIHEQRETIKSKRAVKTDAGVTQNNQQNNYFIGSPAELNRFLAEQK
jgi:hypothetical protein